MDDNAVQALNIAFAVLIFVIALSVTMYMLAIVSTTAENLAFYSDNTKYYESVTLNENNAETDEFIKIGTSRIVNADTVISVLYRYYKENFCVKIYDASDNLIQMFDVETEINVRDAIGSTQTGNTKAVKQANAYKTMYNDSSKSYYLFGASWIGSSQNENIIKRLDYFIAGECGYINNNFVDYRVNTSINPRGNKFKEAIDAGKTFSEKFISYSYTGSSFETDDGDTIVTGNSPKDKIVIIYKIRN